MVKKLLSFTGIKGCHVKGAKSFPSLDLTGSDGIKSADFVTKGITLIQLFFLQFTPIYLAFAKFFANKGNVEE